MKRALSAVMAAGLCLALALTGCTQHPATTQHGPAFLRLVPADSPYVMAALAPAPRDYMERTLRDAGPKMKKALAHLRAIGAASQGQGLKIALALLEQLSENFSVEGFDRIGLGTGVYGVIYGVGLIPVARWEIQDGVKLRDFLTKLFTQIGATVTSSQSGTHNFWSFPIGERGLLTMVVAVEGNEVIMTLAPLATLDKVLPIAFGDRKPAHSLADDDQLGRLSAEYGYAPFGVGWIDLVKVAAILTDETAPGRELLGPLGSAIPSLSPECKSEVTDIVATAPRLVFGATQLSAAGMRGSATLELRPELVAALSLLKVKVPGLGAPLGNAIVEFGAGINVPRAVEFAKLKLSSLQAHPFRCPAFAEANHHIAKLAESLQQPLPAFAEDIRGGLVVLNELNLSGAFDLNAYAVVAANDTTKLLELIGRYLPVDPHLNVPADGKPVNLPLQLPMLPKGWIARTGQALGVAMGQGSDAQLVTALSAPSASDDPFFFIAYDSAKWNRVVSQIGDVAQAMSVDQDGGKLEMSIGVNAHGVVFTYGLLTP